MSNLEGPGRIIGNLYSRAGRALERRLLKVAYPSRSTFGRFERVETDLANSRVISSLASGTMEPQEKITDMLFDFASCVAPSFSFPYTR